MGRTNADDYFWNEDDPGEARYADVVPPERPLHEKPSRNGSHHDGHASGEKAGSPGVNSPQVPPRLPDFEEKSGFEFGFLNADVGSEPREEAREMVLEMRGSAATLEELDQEPDDANDDADDRESPASALQPSLAELYNQVRTILDMAGRVEQQLKTLLAAESTSGATGLRPVPPSPSLAAGPLATDSASNDVDGPTVTRGDVQHAAIEQATADEHWPEASGTSGTQNGRPLKNEEAAVAPVGTESQPTRSRRGRKMTPARRDEIIHYIRAGLSIRQAASFVGCHHTTIIKAAQRDPEFAWKLEQAESMGESLPLVRVIRASRQSWRAAAWLYKNHQPSARLRREAAAERDAEAAESIVRLDRLLRQQIPDVDLKATLRGDRISLELRPRKESVSGATGVSPVLPSPSLAGGPQRTASTSSDVEVRY